MQAEQLARYPGLVIPVIDLFAGPGGLGEGFASRLDKDGNRIFRIALSIEMNEDARTTLRLRSFFRQFEPGKVPHQYYKFLAGEISAADLYTAFPSEAAASDNEAWQAELGKVDPDEVDRRIKAALDGSQEWILIGGPPCQAYSLAGRSRVKNVDPKKYETDHRHFLYQEYLRILAVHQPPIFVMENVKGILSSKMKGSLIVEKILADLAAPLAEKDSPNGAEPALKYALHPFADYGDSLPFGDQKRAPSDYIIRAELHGIPQARHRFIVMGVRGDIPWRPKRLRNEKKSINVWNAIRDLPRLRSRLSGKGSSRKERDTARVWASSIREILTLPLTTTNCIDLEVKEKIEASAEGLRMVGGGGQFVPHPAEPSWRRSWFRDARLRGVCNHESRRHMKDDLWRYLFAACYADVHKRSPTLYDFPPELLPDHKNIQMLDDDDGDLAFADRFRVQVKLKYSTTVTSHIAKDGHYFIHYDPKQCRSLTVREAARLQTFPDNYFFTGGKTAQYQQVGNAVPPLLAWKLAGIVSSYFDSSRA